MRDKNRHSVKPRWCTGGQRLQQHNFIETLCHNWNRFTSVRKKLIKVMSALSFTLYHMGVTSLTFRLLGDSKFFLVSSLKKTDCPWDCSRSLLSHKQSCVCVSLSMMPVLNEVLPVNRSVTEFDFAFLNVVEFWQFRQFPHSNPTDVQRLFLVEFKFAFELRNSKLFWLPRLQINTKWKAINISTPTASKARMWHLHCAIRCYWLLATDWYIKSLLKLENSLLNTEIVKFTFSF